MTYQLICWYWYIEKEILGNQENKKDLIIFSVYKIN